MKRISLAFAIIVALSIVHASSAEARHGYGGGGFGGAPASRTFGLGLILGAPTGLSAEIRMGPRTGLDLALGLDAYEHNDFYLHLDYLVYAFDLSPGGSVSLPFYLGVGMVLWDGRNKYDDNDLRLGLRVPFGLALALRAAPVQFFLEGALRVLFVDQRNGDYDRVDVTLAGGFRVYF